MRWHVTYRTANRKLGPIATTTSGQQTCPDSCPLSRSGCYGDGGPVAIHWAKVTDGRAGTGQLATHCQQIEAASAMAGKIRLHQVGDLPADLKSAQKIVSAPADGSIAWTYTHRTGSLRWLRSVNRSRTTVNASANTLREADRYLARGLPTVCLSTEPDRKQSTPDGRTAIRCPAEYREGITCDTCGNGRPLCARKDRTFAVLFTPHGSSARKAADVAKG